LVANARPSFVATCPFCHGNEHLTPESLDEQSDEQGHWRTRVVPNMFPAVTVDSAAIGVHEVIVESPIHYDRMSSLSLAELEGVFKCYARRLNHWRIDGRFAYGTVFKNQGPAAGASLSHLHSQFMALPAVPPDVDAEIHRAKGSFQKGGDCPYCRLIDSERSAGERIVFDGDGYIAFCPFASWQPHEVWILPTRHEPSFERATKEAGVKNLAKALKPLVDRLETLTPGAACNWLLRTAPWQQDCDRWCHWRLELLPRVHSFAGLEIGTGIHINPLPPERAAANLRA
jgi:UDPglucose--hexose-1-phosphate uridylyltransferase